MQIRKRLAAAVTAIALTATASMAQQSSPPQDVEFYGVSENSPIAGGVVIPAGRAMVWTSGTVPPLFNERAEAGAPERYGDTKIQATGVLRRIESQLREQGLSLQDVVYIRAYLVPDPQLGTIDMQGWSEAFAEFFATPSNPTKPARSTVGVAALVNPDWLIEIEAFAVYPE